MKKYLAFAAFLLLLVALLPVAYAQEESSDSDLSKSRNTSYRYDAPTMQNLSRLYWALSKLDINDDEAIDNYLMINECDVWKDYYHDEFEWQNIRKTGREFIAAGKNTFPLRFEIMQPLHLKEYDFKKGGIEVRDDYKINGLRRFEIMADDYDKPMCTFDISSGQRTLPGYPMGLLIELNRPITLDLLKVDPEVAKEYTEAKIQRFKALNPDQQTTERLYEMRDAYLVMKVKFFSYKKDVSYNGGMKLAEVLGFLEKIEIYGDQKKKMLLYSEDFSTQKKRKTLNEALLLPETDADGKAPADGLAKEGVPVISAKPELQSDDDEKPRLPKKTEPAKPAWGPVIPPM